jgi:hypothetical protein
MKANEISTFSEAEGLLTDFRMKNDIPVWLVRSLGPTREYVARGLPPDGKPTWSITINDLFAIVLEVTEFPNHLVGELMDLASGLRNRLDEMGS